VAYLVICLFFGLAGGWVGRLKGSSFLLWFLISALVPLLGLLAAVLYRFETDEVRRQCPRCGRVVKLYDQVCMRCGEDLDFPETAIVPASEAVASRRRDRAAAARR
jgi:peptidoglycan/LPS O-acetylase OafA/YrhL